VDLTPLISPASIAVIGASDNPGRLGGRVLANLMKGFGGPVTPVSPARDVVQGIPAVPAVTAMASAPDMAIIVLPSSSVLDAARDCARKGVRALIVISSGFGETGPEGRAAQDELARVAKDAGIALLGPNCVGVLNVATGMRASFVALTGIPLRAGNIAIVSQSGAFGLALFEAAQQRGVGTSYLCTSGNEAGVTCAELIGHLIEQPDVRVIVTYLEGLADPGNLLRAGRRALELGKPIVAMKVGGSRTGAQAVVSHTGSLAVPDRVVDAAFGRAGVIRAGSPQELIDLATVFSAQRLPQGRGVAVLTGSGGVGVAMADAGEAAGLDLHPPSPALRARLERMVPPFGSVRNPIDHTAHLVNDRSRYEELIATLAATDDYDTLCMANVSRTQMPRIAEFLGELSRSVGRPLVAQSHYPEIARELCLRGVPTIADPVATMRAVAAVSDWSARRAWLLEEPAPAADPVLAPAGAARPLGGRCARALLEQTGIPFAAERVIKDSGDAVAALGELGGRVALKLLAASLPHKTEAGAVLLDLRNAEEVAAGWRALQAVAAELRGPDEPVVVAQQMMPRGTELICGGFRDPTFGPVVTVGLGGTLVEIAGIQEQTLAPVSPRMAGRMLERLAGGRLLGGPRGLGSRQAVIVRDVIVAIGRLMAERPDVAEVDLNPVIVTADRVAAVDAVVTIRDG
jgi:acetate---CoA ligase (ADP-forming)